MESNDINQNKGGSMHSITVVERKFSYVSLFDIFCAFSKHKEQKTVCSIGKIFSRYIIIFVLLN